jgi:hypothetical protein
MEKTQSFRKWEYWQEALIIPGLLGLGFWLLSDRPRYEYLLPILGMVVISLLFEIRGKLEAIRFMMAYDLDKKLDHDFRQMLDQD